MTRHYSPYYRRENQQLQLQPNLSAFVVESHVRSTWIAFLTLWVLWGFVYFVRHAFEAPGKTCTAEEVTTEKKVRFLPQAGGFTVRTLACYNIDIHFTHYYLLLLIYRSAGTRCKCVQHSY